MSLLSQSVWEMVFLISVYKLISKLNSSIFSSAQPEYQVSGTFHCSLFMYFFIKPAFYSHFLQFGHIKLQGSG